jgi:hypothetical protein
MHNGSGVELWATAIGFLNKVLRIKAIPHRKLEMLAFFLFPLIIAKDCQVDYDC